MKKSKHSNYYGYVKSFQKRINKTLSPRKQFLDIYKPSVVTQNTDIINELKKFISLKITDENAQELTKIIKLNGLEKKYNEINQIFSEEINNIFYHKLRHEILPKYFTKEFIDNLVKWEWDFLLKELSVPKHLKEIKYPDIYGYINMHLPVYCPICKSFLFNEKSDYLLKITKNSYIDYSMLFLVTHYRHNHINYYDRSWKYPKYREKNKEYSYYDEFKYIVNSRAKRQIARALFKDENVKVKVKKQMLNVYLMKKYRLTKLTERMEEEQEKTKKTVVKILDKIN